MRLISQKRRDRIAFRFALSAFAAIVSGVLGAIFVAPHAYASVFPLAGLVGYVLCAHRAMRLWQGSRGAYPRRESSRRRPFGAVAIAVITAGSPQTTQGVPGTHVPPATKAAGQAV